MGFLSGEYLILRTGYTFTSQTLWHSYRKTTGSLRLQWGDPRPITCLINSMSCFPVAITGIFLGVAPNKPVMSISINISDQDEIPDYNIQADFVRHARRTTHDAVYLALGSYKAIKFKADITIGKFPKSQRVSRRQRRLFPFSCEI